MALIILTALGLTLAATTSTELQVAANYRWSQQALYNAEAGLEIAKRSLVQIWGNLPPPRTAPWDPGVDPAAPAVVPSFPGTRNNEMWTCDTRGGGMGYGFVLDGLENQTSYMGMPLNGSFTVWARWPLDYNPNGTIQERSKRDAIIVVAEGTAPYAYGQGARQVASQVLEATFYTNAGDSSKGCKQRMEMAGSGPAGGGYDPCDALDDEGGTVAMGASAPRAIQELQQNP